MSRHTNLAGYVYYDNEAELCQELEKFFFPRFFDKPWQPIFGKHKEVVLSSTNKCRLDYFGYKNNIKTWVEVKNWFATTKNLRQIYKYILGLREFRNTPYNLYLICGGIEPSRVEILQDLDVDIILVKDIKEVNYLHQTKCLEVDFLTGKKLNPMGVVHWM